MGDTLLWQVGQVPREAKRTTTAMSYGLIYADPPWRYANMEVQGNPENHYPTMHLSEICALRVETQKDAVLALWATAPLLPEALQVMKSWGFTYKTCMVWDKERLGLGYWVRGQHEILMFGTKGKPKVPGVSARPRSVHRCKSGRHSQKPYTFYDILEKMFPDVTRLEMFARYDDKLFKPQGWDLWGNQA